jgi:hypothetical protein
VNPWFVLWAAVTLVFAAAIVVAAVIGPPSDFHRRTRPRPPLHPVDDEPWTEPRWRE